MALALVGGFVLGACTSADTAPAQGGVVDASAEDGFGDDSEAVGTGDLAADTPLDPCGLITPDQAGDALSEPVDAGVGQEGSLSGQLSCVFCAIDSSHSVTVSVMTGDDAVWSSLRKQSPAAKKVANIGDDAFRDGGVLQMRSGDVIITLDIGGLGSGADLADPLNTLAKAALAEM